MSQGHEQILLRPPGIKSVGALACALELHPELIQTEAAHAARYYNPFFKRSVPAPFAKRMCETKPRLIDNPTDVLKDIQSRIYCRLLRPIILPDHIFGGVRGKNAKENVARHLGAKVIVTLDIRNFFREISNLQVFDVWHKMLDHSPEVSRLLTQLTTFEHHLPLGSATSCTLANLLLFSHDSAIRNYCAKNGILYSNWIDDLIFSGDQSPTVIGIAVKALRRGGFSIAHRKLKIMPGHKRQTILGIVMNRHPGIRKEYISGIRSGIHKLATGQVPPGDIQSYVCTLQGKIKYIGTINPRQARPLGLQLLSALGRSPQI